MTEDWAQIKQIFSVALSIPACERDAYVSSACAGREELRCAVAELLSAHCEASQGFLERDRIVLLTSWLFREGDRVADRFKIFKRIARGAMGEVYQVYDERLRLHVALKAIRPELIGEKDTAERFRREVSVTRDIAHDGLCRVFDLVEHVIDPQPGFPDGVTVPCLTMQLLEGETLEECLNSGRPMSPPKALPLVKQIAEALEALHDAGVVHRDLKPSNVMLVATGGGTRAVLTDFGLARPIDEGVFDTQSRGQAGAPYFMAPELLRGERPSIAADVYAFGLLIDEMITETRAFSAESLHALLLQKLGDGPLPPSQRAHGVPRTWERTILRCLARDPRDRFASARAVLDALCGNAPWISWPIRVPRLTARWQTRVAGYSVLTGLLLTGAATIGKPIQLLAPQSVAIRPFSNLTNQREFEYLAVGTAGELGRRLSRVPDLRVYNQRDATTPLDAAARATFTLQGHVQEVDSALRISVQLIDTAEGTLLWSQNFDGTPQQALELEDQLAADTVGALTRLHTARQTGPFHRAAALLGGLSSTPRVPSTGTTSSAAFDAYLRGRALFEERTLPGALQAIEYLKRAIHQDPNFAAAYATLADVQFVLMDLHYAAHARLLNEAERYANQAVAVDPDLPDAQLSLAALRQAQWRWNESEAAYRRAIKLHPTSARAHRWYAGLLLQFGQFEDSLRLHRRGLELDPYDYPSQSAYGHALFNAGRAAEAASHLERVVAQKDMLYAHVLLGQVYAYLCRSQPERSGEYLRNALRQSDIIRAKESAAAPRGAVAVVTEYADLVAALAWSYQRDLDAAAPFLERLEAGRDAGRVSPSVLARVYAAQADVPRATEALLAAEAQHDRELLYLNVSPYYTSIRDEPQVRALIERLHLVR